MTTFSETGDAERSRSVFSRDGDASKEASARGFSGADVGTTRRPLEKGGSTAAILEGSERLVVL